MKLRNMVVTVLVSAFNIAYSQNQDDPVFLDQVQCIYSKNSELSFLDAYTNPNVAKLASKVHSIESCEKQFHSFGISPLQWVNPHKLNLAIRSMEQSYLYQEAKIEIISGKKEGHVSLKATIVKEETKNHIDIKYQMSIDKAIGDESDRRTQEWELGYSPLYLNSKIEPYVDFYLKRRLSTSDDAVEIKDEDITELTELQKASLRRKDSSYGEFGTRLNIPQTWNDADLFLGFMGNSSKLSYDEEGAISSKFTMGLRFNKALKILTTDHKSEIFIESIARELPVYEVVSIDEENDDKRINTVKGSDEYIGIRLLSESKSWYKVEIDYRRMLSKEVNYYLHEQVYLPFYNISSGHFGAGLELERNHNYSGVEQRIILPYYTATSLYLGTGFKFNMKSSEHALKIDVGSRSLQSDKNGDLDGYKRSSGFVEISYMIYHDHFTTKFGFLSGKRLY